MSIKSTKSIGFTMLVVPLFLAGCAAFDTEPQVSDAGWVNEQTPGASGYATGKSHFAAGRYGLAIKAFHASIEGDPNSIETLNGLAASYDKLGRFDLAERYYRQALSLDPESSQSLNNLGYSYLLQGKYDLATVYLREANLLDQENQIIYANRQTAEAALQSIGWSESLAKAPVTSVESADLVASSKLWVERTSKGVQSLRVTQAGDQFAARGAVGSTSPGARFVAAGQTQEHGKQSDPGRDRGPYPGSGAVIAIKTRTSDEAVAGLDGKGSLDPLVYLLNSPQRPAIEISNGTGRGSMASRMRDYLKSGGLDITWLSNADHYNYQTSQIYFQEAWRAHAEALAALMPTGVELVQNDLQRAHIRLQLGGDLLNFDSQLYYAKKEVANDAS